MSQGRRIRRVASMLSRLGIRMPVKILATPRGQLAEISAEPAGDGGVHELSPGGLRRRLDARLLGKSMFHSRDARQAHSLRVAVPLAKLCGQPLCLQRKGWVILGT